MSDLTIEIITPSDLGEFRPVREEALRYMGYKSFTPDSPASALIDECEQELMSVMRPLCCFARTDIRLLSDSSIDLGFGEIESCDLTEHLKDCYGAFLFAATIGIGADRLIAKYNRLKPAKSVIIDALGSSAVENWCDHAESRITEHHSLHRSRFSAGYGDFKLLHQKDFMQCLDMNRKLGITLSDSLLMTPTKSVTAVIGLGAGEDKCGGKCVLCKNSVCIYRKEG